MSDLDELTAEVVREDEQISNGYVTFPDMYNADAVADFDGIIAQHNGKRGYAKLSKQWKMAKYHFGLFNDQVSRTKAALDRINGKRSEAQVRGRSEGARKQSIRSTGVKFYAGLSEDTLKRFAKVANINPTMYEDAEALRNALVEDYIEKRSDS